MRSGSPLQLRPPRPCAPLRACIRGCALVAAILPTLLTAAARAQDRPPPASPTADAAAPTATPTWAPAPPSATARALVERMIARTVPADERGIMRWTIFGPDGVQRRRRLSYAEKRGDGGRHFLLLRILEPAEARRTALLTATGGGAGDAQWVYLPEVRRTRRLGAGDRSERFLGSDLAYGDLLAEDAGASEYELLRREGSGDDARDVVLARPSGATPAGRPGRRLHIRTRDAALLKTEVLADDGAVAKTIDVTDLALVGAYARAARIEVRDDRRRSRTVVVVEEREVDGGVPDRVFSERELEEGE